MGDLELGAAIEALREHQMDTDGEWLYCTADLCKWEIRWCERPDFEAHQITAALPHIERAVIQRLIEKYASERTALANASDYGSHDRTARMLSYAIGRLRAELDGRNGE